MADDDKGITEACKKDKDLSEFKVVQLKKYLARRKLNVSGRKEELIQRVKGANKLKITDNYTLAGIDLKQQQETLSERFCIGDESVPSPDQLKLWCYDYNQIPDITEKDIFNYIVIKKNSKRQLKSKIFYEDRHLHKVEIHPVDEKTSHCYVRAAVLPSFPTADKKKSPDYQPWVLLSKVTGCVHSAYCNCTAGEGECCNHIGALLFGILDLTEKRQNGQLAPTSKPCIWNNYSMMSVPRKRKLTPKKSSDLVFKKQRPISYCTRQLFVVKNYETNQKKGCTVNIERFKSRLEGKDLNVGWLKNFLQKPKRKEPEMPVLNNVSFVYMDKVDLQSEECENVFRDHFDTLGQSEEDIQLTETLTRGQNCRKWKEARRERLTSSYFGQVFKRKNETQPDCLLKDIMYSEFKCFYTEYGKKHEKAAVRMYVKYMQAEHTGLRVKDSGLVVCRQAPFLATSPDSLVYCSHCSESNGLLEIKCPASMRWRMKTPEECCLEKEFFCCLENKKVMLKRNHNYFFQVQGQMALTGRKWCDFVVWTCTGISVERIRFDESLWKSMYMRLEKFYVNCFIPELYSRRVERGVKLLKQ